MESLLSIDTKKKNNFPDNFKLSKKKNMEFPNNIWKIYLS